jgi:hypothetical protein
MTTRYTGVARILLVVALMSSPAEAQELAGTFDQLRVLVKPGDTLTVTDAAGVPVRGKLVTLSTASLSLDVSGSRKLFQNSEIDTIARRTPDSLRNGALIGLAIGGGLFGSAVGAATSHWGYAASAALVYGGLGAAIGAGVDAMIEGPRVIYARAAAKPVGISIAPARSGRGRGVVATITLMR